MMIEHSRLVELLDYSPITGIFVRKVSLSNRTPVGSVAGSVNKGYSYINVDGKRYAAHRLAWFYVHKTWPHGVLDHVNTDGTANAVGNLRLANKSTNGANRGLNKNNTSGFKGVSHHRDGFVSRIRVAGRQLHLGSFTDPVLAAKSYDAAAIEHFGQFALTNKSLGLV